MKLAYRWHTPVLVEPDSFAYLTSRATIEERHSELGVYAQGPRAAELASQFAAHIQAWDRDWRHKPGPVFTLHPANATIEKPTCGRIFRRRHVQIVLAWS